MATHRTAALPYRWSNGSYHSRPERTPAQKQTYKPGSSTVPGGGTFLPGQYPSASVAPASPTGPAAPAQPLDPNVVNQQVIARRNVTLGDLRATFDQGNLDQEYGFGAGGAANPYSRAALLQEHFKRSQLGTTNSYAANGQLYSGAYGRMQNENQRNYDIGYDQLRRAYDAQSGNIALDRLGTYANAGTGVDDATFQSLLKQLGGL